MVSGFGAGEVILDHCNLHLCNPEIWGMVVSSTEPPLVTNAVSHLKDLPRVLVARLVSGAWSGQSPLIMQHTLQGGAVLLQ